MYHSGAYGIVTIVICNKTFVSESHSICRNYHHTITISARKILLLSFWPPWVSSWNCSILWCVQQNSPSHEEAKFKERSPSIIIINQLLIKTWPLELPHFFIILRNCHFTLHNYVIPIYMVAIWKITWSQLVQQMINLSCRSS